MMQLHNLLTGRQSNPKSLFLGTKQGFEHILMKFFGNTISIIPHFNGDGQIVIFWRINSENHFRGGFRAVLDRIGNKVLEQLHQENAVCIDSGQFLRMTLNYSTSFLNILHQYVLHAVKDLIEVSLPGFKFGALS